MARIDGTLGIDHLMRGVGARTVVEGKDVAHHAVVTSDEEGRGQRELRFVWLEITGKCQLYCRHCYAASGPSGTHGSMEAGDWLRVLDQAAELGASAVQFIGGEPTLHPGLPILVGRALRHQMEVEVFSNLVRVPEALWKMIEQPGVSLATSYYSSDAKEHNRITARRSHDRTLANIREAKRRGIPLRVGVIDMHEQQRMDLTVEELRELGIAQIGVDYLRQVGRGASQSTPSVDQLCGRCADASLAISPSGEVWPCVFSRWLLLGNVHRSGLAEINQAALNVRTQLRMVFQARGSLPLNGCDPDCRPCEPNCSPKFECNPKKSDGDPHGCPPKKDCHPWE